MEACGVRGMIGRGIKNQEEADVLVIRLDPTESDHANGGRVLRPEADGNVCNSFKHSKTALIQTFAKKYFNLKKNPTNSFCKQ